MSLAASDFTLAARHKLLDCPEFLFELDEYKRGDDQFLLAHVRVASWSPSTLKKIVRTWQTFRQCVSAPVYAFAEEDDNKWERFVSRLGFKPLGLDVRCNNGAQRRLFINAQDNADHVGLFQTGNRLIRHHV